MIKKIWNNRFINIIKIFTIINIILINVNIGLWVRAAQERLLDYADFSSIYNSFVNNRPVEGFKLLGVDVISLFQRGIFGGLRLENGVYPLQYPPVISLVFSPISLLPFNIAYLIWMIVELGLLIWLIFLLNRLFSDWNKQERLLLILTILAFFPLAFTILTGQFSLFLLICLVQIYISMKNIKPINAGIWLSFMLIKPQTILIPGLLAISRRYWRVGVTAAISVVSLIGISSLLFGFDSWIKYSQSLLNMSINFGKSGFQAEEEYTFRGLLTRILGTSQGNIINIISNIALLLGMFVVLFLWFRGISPDSPRFKLRFAFIITISVFLSLHLYGYDNLILVLPAAIFYDYLRQMGLQRRGYSILMLCSPLIFFFGMFNSFNLFGFIRPPIVVTLLLIAWMIRYMILDFKAEQANRQTNLTSPYPP